MGAPVATAGEPDATPTAVMIGRLDRGEGYKGHREVISCWPQVLRRLPQARLWIVGEGDLLPELVRHVEQLGLGSCVAFWGWVSEEDKERLLTRSRCLALPSRGEGFGLVYAEAMRLGRPCLVGTEDAGREVVDPPTAGLAADPDDLCSLTDGLCRLMDDTPAWRSQSVQARKRYEKLFTAERFQERLLEALGLS